MEGFMKKYFNKQTFAAFILGAILFTSVGVFAEALNVVPNAFPVLINGVVSKVDAFNINGYTYFKLADLQQTGLKVVFNETDSKIEITSVPTDKNTTTAPTTEPAKTTTPPQTTPSQEETTQPPEVTQEQEPEQEPAPDLTVYNAKLDLLAETYNQDVKKIKDEAREKAGQLSQDFYKKYPNAKREDSVNWGSLFKILDENINIVYKKSENQIELRTKAYDIEVLELKQEYGVE